VACAVLYGKSKREKENSKFVVVEKVGSVGSPPPHQK
jgi:hypothetical protein